MNLEKLQKQITLFNNFIDTQHKERTQTERKLLKAAKLPEEVGEFYNEFLISLNFTREGKQGDRKELEKELADVILTSLVIAEELEVDIFSVLQKKMDTVCERFGLE